MKANTTAQVRKEIKNELENAIKNGITNGNIVTSDGKVIKFEITYHVWHLTTGIRNAAEITIVKGNHKFYDLKFAVSAALYEYGYTKYAQTR